MASNLLAAGTALETSADFVVADGSAVGIVGRRVDGAGGGARQWAVSVDFKNADNSYTSIARIDQDHNAGSIQMAGTYRLSRVLGNCAVDRT